MRRKNLGALLLLENISLKPIISLFPWKIKFLTGVELQNNLKPHGSGVWASRGHGWPCSPRLALGKPPSLHPAQPLLLLLPEHPLKHRNSQPFSRCLLQKTNVTSSAAHILLLRISEGSSHHTLWSGRWAKLCSSAFPLVCTENVLSVSAFHMIDTE